MTQVSILSSVERLYAHLGSDTEPVLAEMRALYASDIVFVDPIQTTHGIEAFVGANRRFANAMNEIRFVMHDRMEDEARAFCTWTFVVQPKRGLRFSIHGASHLRLASGKIVWHRDYWDLWGSLAESLPGAGAIYRRLVHLLA